MVVVMNEERNMISGYDLNYVYDIFNKAKKNDLIKRYVDNLVIVGGDVKINETDVLIYAGNHQSLLDYLLPHYALLDVGWPYPRTVAGKNLDDFPLRQILQLGKKGMIWVDKDRVSEFGYKRRFIRIISGLLISGNHILDYAEGGRNYDADGEVKEFKRGVFDASLDAQIKCDTIGIRREFFIFPFAVHYETIPERDFFEKMRIARERGSNLAYYSWDLYAYFRWKYIERKKGEARIKFGDKLSVRDLVRDKGLGRKSLVEFIRQEVIRLKNEIS